MHFLSYNLLKHKAAHEIEELINKHNPAALCLQEVKVEDMPESLGKMKLAVGTSKNRLGLAIYIDEDHYETESTASFKLKDAHYDRIASPAHERLLGVKFINRETAEETIVGSFHASPLTALNALRRDQIRDGLDNLNEMGNKETPLIMLGDFNYPIFRKRLEREMFLSGFDLSTSDEHTYRHFKGTVSGFFDFAVSRGFSKTNLRTLQQGVSDHLPILAKAERAA